MPRGPRTRVRFAPSWGVNLTRTLGLTALALLAVATIALVARPGAEAGAATTCTKHAKRVVTHVKRRGKSKRVVRIRHFRTCKPVATPAPTPAPSPVPSAPSPAPATPSPAAAPSTTTPLIEPIFPEPTPPLPPTQPEAEPEANALGVSADDRGGVKSYTLSRQTVRSGRLTVQLQNKGEDPHDMEMQKVGPGGEPLGATVEVPVTEPGEQKTQSVTVEPGTYRMWCNLREHAKEGMEATVVVE
jgi:plastocyanin